jgi:hypothetical protein
MVESYDRGGDHVWNASFFASALSGVSNKILLTVCCRARNPQKMTVVVVSGLISNDRTEADAMPASHYNDGHRWGWCTGSHSNYKSILHQNIENGFYNIRRYFNKLRIFDIYLGAYRRFKIDCGCLSQNHFWDFHRLHLKKMIRPFDESKQGAAEISIFRLCAWF